MQPRSPIVTILGHVDHGKTTLLDYIRKSRLTAKEHGGITQSIGAYEIDIDITGYDVKHITFIDTPGHEAFTKLRSRGANVADIALLIIDAVDSLKPQTIESISHIKSAKIPYIVVANKTDLPNANPEKVKIDLLKHEVLVEGKGGDVPFVAISATTGAGIPELLETILLITAHNQFTFDPKAPAEAYIIETNKDKRGQVISAIIKNGVLKRGDKVYTSKEEFKIRALTNDLGKQVDQVTPSQPFQILGSTQLPDVGSVVSTQPLQATVTEDKKEDKKKSIMDQLMTAPVVEDKKLPVIVKAESQGSLEAILYTINENPDVDLKLASVGEISNSDVFLAKTTKAIIVGFRVEPTNDVRELAKQEKVVIKTYNIIYQLLDELAEVALLIREKQEQEKNAKGEGKVLATFIIEGEKVFGMRVTKGKVNLGDHGDVYRNNNQVGTLRLISLRVRAKKVDEVKKDQEAGMLFDTRLDLQVGDVIKFVL